MGNLKNFVDTQEFVPNTGGKESFPNDIIGGQQRLAGQQPQGRNRRSGLGRQHSFAVEQFCVRQKRGDVLAAVAGSFYKVILFATGLRHSRPRGSDEMKIDSRVNLR